MFWMSVLPVASNFMMMNMPVFGEFYSKSQPKQEQSIGNRSLYDEDDDDEDD